MPEIIVATTSACAATNCFPVPKASVPKALTSKQSTSALTTAPTMPPAACAIHCARGCVPNMAPALKSFITSPISPHATLTTAATKKSCTCGALPKAATTKSTMTPNTSMGFMPLSPTLCALIETVRKVSNTTTMLAAGPSCNAKHKSSATAAAVMPAMPSSFLVRLLRQGASVLPPSAAFSKPTPLWQLLSCCFFNSAFAPVLMGVEFVARTAPRNPHEMPQTPERPKTNLIITATPHPIIAPMPSELLMP